MENSVPLFKQATECIFWEARILFPEVISKGTQDRAFRGIEGFDTHVVTLWKAPREGCAWLPFKSMEWNDLLRFSSICDLSDIENLLLPSYPSHFWKWKTDVCEDFTHAALWSEPVPERIIGRSINCFKYSSYCHFQVILQKVYYVHMQEQDFFLNANW